MKTGQALLLAALAFAPAGAALAQAYGQGATQPGTQGGTTAAATSQVEISVAGAKTEQEARERLSADALLARCVIKPVMTDAEIDLCKRAYVLTRQANPDRR